MFRGPAAGAYAKHRVYGEEAVVSPQAFPDLEVPVANLFLAPRDEG